MPAPIKKKRRSTADSQPSGIGKYLLEYREQHGISQAELAEKLGVKQTTISSWERVIKVPGSISLLRISDETGIPIRTLVQEKLEKSPRK